MKTSFKSLVEAIDSRFSTFQRLETLQVNLGDLCNLRCAHCHHHASPEGSNIMGRDVMEKIAEFLAHHPGLTLDITGGCPEMNPDFRFFVEATAGLASRRIIRSNLVIALEDGMEWLPDFYREQELVIMASLPCYVSKNLERQRGDGSFTRSIEVLRQLNTLGYGSELELHLVHNPGSASPAGPQKALEQDYRRELLEQYGITFSSLHCMNNAPLGRFRDSLERTGGYDCYVEQLSAKFNPKATERIMCRTLVSVGWDGVIYNCDFNLAEGMPVRRSTGSAVTIEAIQDALVPGSLIAMADHCFSCTAGEGSGCGGTFAAFNGKKGLFVSTPVNVSDWSLS